MKRERYASATLSGVECLKITVRMTSAHRTRQVRSLAVGAYR
jgi:hypothetical protein